MAILAGGNPVSGSNPSGTGAGIVYIADHVYGNSGTLTANPDITPFDFTSGSGSYIVAKMFIGYDSDDLTGNDKFGYRIIFNNESIFFTRRKANADDLVTNPLPSRVDFIIPPETHVTVEAFTNGSILDMSFIITGRVYQ